MPAKQRGSVGRHGTGWRARWLDEHGERKTKGGFATKTEAADYLDAQVKEVVALRRGDLIPATHRPQTIDALLDTFIEKHGATVDSATLRTLKARLKHARSTFG